MSKPKCISPDNTPSLFADHVYYSNRAKSIFVRNKDAPINKSHCHALHDRAITNIDIAESYYLNKDYITANIYIAAALSDAIAALAEYKRLPATEAMQNSCIRLMSACEENLSNIEQCILNETIPCSPAHSTYTEITSNSNVEYSQTTPPRSSRPSRSSRLFNEKRRDEDVDEKYSTVTISNA